MALQNEYSTNLGLTVTPEVDQKKYPEIFFELLKIRNAITGLQGALDSYTGALPEDPQYWNVAQPAQFTRVQNIARFYALASENIGFGFCVHFWNNSGVTNARLANAADNTKPCRAFCNVPAGVTTGNYGEFILMGVNPYISGLTPGVELYLSASTPGGFTATAPSGAGKIVQKVGHCLDNHNIFFNPVLNWTQL